MPQVATVRAAALVDRPQGFRFTARGFIVTRKLSSAEYDQVGRRIGSIVNGANWAVGDWLQYGELQGYPGAKYSRAQELTGLTYEVLSQAARVAAAYLLEASAGEVVAKLVVEERVSVVLDLSLFRKHEVATFMTAFLENLYRLKAREQYRTPMMLVIDEADAIAPQKPQKGEERMLGAAEDIVRRGGQRGIGCVLVTQRSAVLNKNVLTQAQMLVALRTIAPQDLAAMNAWIDVHGTEDQKRTLMESLPSLPVGDAWFWSPGWPDADGIFQRVHVLPIETFDSSATPKAGEKRIEPKKPADVDLEALKRQMAATIEKAKADDPRELRRQIAELKKQNQQILDSKQAKVAPVPPPKVVEKFVLKDGQLRRAEGIVTALANEVARHEAAVKDRLDLLRELTQELGAAIGATKPGIDRALIRPEFDPLAGRREERTSRALSSAPAAPRGTGTPRPAPSSNGDATVGNSGLRRMLIALAQRPQGLTRRQLGLRAGLSSQSGTFDTYLSKARTQGWVEGSATIQITDAGRTALGTYDPLPEGRELLDYWLGELGNSGAARMLRALATVYPRALTRAELGEAANLSDQSGTFDTYLSRLRGLELVEGRGELRASEELCQ